MRAAPLGDELMCISKLLNQYNDLIVVPNYFLNGPVSLRIEMPRGNCHSMIGLARPGRGAISSAVFILPDALK
jgi:hypothetical protein